MLQCNFRYKLYSNVAHDSNPKLFLNIRISENHQSKAGDLNRRKTEATMSKLNKNEKENT